MISPAIRRFVKKLQAYNIHLDPSLVLIRPVGDKEDMDPNTDNSAIRVQQLPPNMATLTHSRWATSSRKPSSKPGASRCYSDFGRGDWLKDIRSVGTMQIPDWMLSNYFYREMSMALRWVLLPFLLLAGVTVIAILGEILRVAGIFDYNIIFHNPLMSRLGIIDNVLQVVITINSLFLILFGIPALVVERDLMRTLHRFRLQTSHGVTNLDSEAPYLKGAQEVFQADDKVAVFIFGHTHSAFLRRLGPAGQVVINTGTWLKLLTRVPVRFGLLPAVYYPFYYRLNYFRILKRKTTNL